MSHWNFWEWLGYATVWYAGTILALDTAVKMAPRAGLDFRLRWPVALAIVG